MTSPSEQADVTERPSVGERTEEGLREFRKALMRHTFADMINAAEAFHSAGIKPSDLPKVMRVVEKGKAWLDSRVIHEDQTGEQEAMFGENAECDLCEALTDLDSEGKETPR